MDWIESFLDYTSGLPSPLIFRQWCAISAVAGALERRVHVMSAGKPVFPNLYVLLVATPGVGKNVIQEVHNVWFEAKQFKVAPNSITKAGLVDALAEAATTIIRGSDLTEYHSMLVASAEFGVLVPAHDLDFLSSLNYIFDNPPSYVERRRWVNQGKEIVIVHPQLNIIAGTQPHFLHSLLPEEAWGMGTTSRLIMIYAAEPVEVDLHLEEQGKPNGYLASNVEAEATLVAALAAMHDLHGVMMWTGRAKALIEAWKRERFAPVPDHSKLIHYNPRRVIHALKLCMVSAASRGKMVIDADDVNRGRGWLLEAEQRMPDIFRAMTGRSDKQIIDELHRYMWSTYAKDQKPIHESFLIDFVAQRAPQYAVLKILEVAERAHYLVRDAGTKMYRPRHTHERGVE